MGLLAIIGPPACESGNMEPYETSVKYIELSDSPLAKSIFPENRTWRLNFGGMTKPQIRFYLETKLSDLEHQSLHQLKNYLVELSPTKLIQNEGDVWLHLKSKSNGLSLYLSCSANPASANKQLSHLKFASDFFDAFSGLRCQPPGHAGNFSGVNHTQLKHWLVDCESEVSNKWRESLGFYYASNGDQLVVAEDGQIAWHILGENRIEQVEGSLLDVVGIFVECHKSGKDFNSYSFKEIDWSSEKKGHN